MDQVELLEQKITTASIDDLLEVYRQIWLGPDNTIGLTPERQFLLDRRVADELRARGIPQTELDHIRRRARS